MPIDVMRELERIIQADQHDPFTVLGTHFIKQQPPAAVIRTFQPHAESVTLLRGNERRPLYRMREEGIFEVIISDCSAPFDYQLEALYYDRSVRTFRDAYRFLPQLSDFDCHLISQGTHYELYNKMGAHPHTIEIGRAHV